MEELLEVDQPQGLVVAGRLLDLGLIAADHGRQLVCGVNGECLGHLPHLLNLCFTHGLRFRILSHMRTTRNERGRSSSQTMLCEHTGGVERFAGPLLEQSVRAVSTLATVTTLSLHITLLRAAALSNGPESAGMAALYGHQQRVVLVVAILVGGIACGCKPKSRSKTRSASSDLAGSSSAEY